MSRKRFITIISVLLLAAASTCYVAAASVWETVKTEIQDAKQVVKVPEVEILTMPATIIVNANKQINIQVFTMLGRLVSSETLPAGQHRLPVGAHGVYIVKVGELTCKVAI